MGAFRTGFALRRSHAAALAALWTLLLLPSVPRAFLRSLRPVPVPDSHNALADLPANPPLTANLNTPPASLVSIVSNTPPALSDTPPPESQLASVLTTRLLAHVTNTTVVPSLHVMRVRDVYEAGHERPHPELCPSLGAHLRLLVLVTSAPSHAIAREAVRLTWGHYAARRDVALAFMLGAPPAALRPELEAEDALYGDIIMGRSVDSYFNLTLKTLSILEWADTYCPLAPRLLKADDDIFINMPHLLQFAAARENATHTIWGYVIHKGPTVRSNESKHYVSPLQFPSHVLPDYTMGLAYLLTADTVRALFLAAPDEPYLPMEDVFVTGVLALKLDLTLSNVPDFNVDVMETRCALKRSIAIHMVQYHEQFDLWCNLLDGKTKCFSKRAQARTRARARALARARARAQ